MYGCRLGKAESYIAVKLPRQSVRYEVLILADSSADRTPGFFETENFPLSFPYLGESYSLALTIPMVEWRNWWTHQS